MLKHQNSMISFSTLYKWCQDKLLVWMGALFCFSLCFTSICSSGYLLPSKVKQMECYHSVSSTSRLTHTYHNHSHWTTPCNHMHTAYTNMQHICRLWFQMHSPNFHFTLGTRLQRREDGGCPKNIERKASSFPKQLGRQVTPLSNHKALSHKMLLNPVWRFDTGFG